MRRPAPARRLLMVVPARREMRFATRSAFQFVPIQHYQRRWKRWRARLPGPTLTRKPKPSRAKSPKRRSICAACGLPAINCGPTQWPIVTMITGERSGRSSEASGGRTRRTCRWKTWWHFRTRRKGRTSSQQSSHKKLNNYWRWTAMDGERYPGESLPFEPSMRHADGRLIAIIERTTYSCLTGRTKPKCSIFSMHGRSHRKSGSARMTLRPPNGVPRQ
jgi:hypothetical protein